MALLGAGKIRTSALADLDNSISSVESFKDKTNFYQSMVSDASCNINFAERIGVITALEAQAYRERLYRARDNIESKQNTERIAEQVKADRHRSYMEHRAEELSKKNEIIESPQQRTSIEHERVRSKY